MIVPPFFVKCGQANALAANAIAVKTPPSYIKMQISEYLID